jgi:hypothetical protein
VRAPELALEIRADDGARVFATGTPLTLTPGGRSLLQFEIPSLPLLGGDYDLLLAAGERTAGGDPVTASADRAVRFSVPHELGGEGIADLRGTWQVLSGVEVAG